MIDIHCHLLYGVDDGPVTFEESVQMLKKAQQQGVDAIILTPHYRHGMFPYNNEKIEKHFHFLKPAAKAIGIDLYLGCEYHINSNVIEYCRSGRTNTLAGSPFILAEYGYEAEYSYIRQTVKSMLAHGYKPVIAHVERYRCMLQDKENAWELSEMGAWIQINADAVLGLEGRQQKRYTKYLLKNELADVIGSDSHGMENRTCHLLECRQYISKKYSQDYGELLFSGNPGRIIDQSTENRS